MRQPPSQCAIPAISGCDSTSGGLFLNKIVLLPPVTPNCSQWMLPSEQDLDFPREASFKNETDVQISVENESGTQPCSVEENFPQLSAEKQSVSTPDVNKESVCLQGESTSLHPQNKTSIWGSSPKNEVTSPPQENISSERKRTLPSWLVKVTTSSEGKLGTQKPVPEIVQSDKSVEDRKGKRCVRKRTDSFHDSEFEDKGKECSRKYDSSSDSGGGQETYKNRSKERPGSDEEELTVTPGGLVDLVTNATETIHHILKNLVIQEIRTLWKQKIQAVTMKRINLSVSME
ncbi:uncharacterized protein LOC143241986 [Tachypleus tridentatus]|uniref:uncharacterized protein LOC143241986 n=1 Tax=Tachypleus tridentatus TaxID=6853 RepID=UPI003FD57F96